jgi:predicted ATP-grasp superfamily ATP-dependent carboligase
MSDFTASVKVIESIRSILNVDVPLEELEELVHHYQQEMRMMKMKREEPTAPMYG